MHRHLNRFKGKQVIALVALLGIVLITAGATYAWFSYSKSGAKENTISAGSITFHYTEGAQGLSLNDAMPMTDNQGKAQNTYFDFTITSKTSSTVEIPYDITVRRSGTGTNMDNVVKVYLTKVNNDVEIPVEIVTGKQIATVSELSTYLNSTLNIDISKNERRLIRETVPTNSSNYNQTYRLRMWISDTADFSGVEVTKYYCDGTETLSINYDSCEGEKTTRTETQYPYNNKTYTLNVNVYGEGVENNSTFVFVPGTLEAGLYDINGNVVKTWTELESLGLTKETIEKDYTNSNWNKEGSPYKVFTDNNLAGNLVFPNTITKIGDRTFRNTGLTSIDVPDSVTSIGNVSFYGIKILYYTGTAEDTSNSNWGALVRNPYVEESFAYIDDTKTTLVAYLGSDSTVTIPSSVISIGQSAFANTGITSVTIPASVTSIGEDAFYYCNNLETVTFAPNSELTSIGMNAFRDTGITSITIPASVTSIGGYAFTHCSNLTTVTFAENSQLTSIGTFVFGSTGITSVEIPSGVTSIGNYAFRNCSSLATVTFAPNSELTSIGYNTFQDSNLSSIEIPSGVTGIGHNAFSGTPLTTVTFTNPNGWSIGGTVALSSTDLSNTSTAATYLKDTYGAYDWTRSN